MSDTDLQLRFDPPVAVEVKGRRRELSAIAFYAEHPLTVVDLLRSRVLTSGR